MPRYILVVVCCFFAMETSFASVAQIASTQTQEVDKPKFRSSSDDFLHRIPEILLQRIKERQLNSNLRSDRLETVSLVQTGDGCAAGRYLLLGVCKECVRGKYSKSANSNECSDCPENFYSSAGSATCSSCPQGQTSSFSRTTCQDAASVPAVIIEAVDVIIMLLYGLSIRPYSAPNHAGSNSASLQRGSQKQPQETGEKIKQFFSSHASLITHLLVLASTIGFGFGFGFGLKDPGRAQAFAGASAGYALLMIVNFIFSLKWPQYQLIENASLSLGIAIALLIYYGIRNSKAASHHHLFLPVSYSLLTVILGQALRNVIFLANTETGAFFTVFGISLICIFGLIIVTLMSKMKLRDDVSEFQLTNYSLATHMFDLVGVGLLATMMIISKAKDRLRSSFGECLIQVVKADEMSRLAKLSNSIDNDSMGEFIHETIEKVESGDCEPIDHYASTSDFVCQLVKESCGSYSNEEAVISSVLGSIKMSRISSRCVEGWSTENKFITSDISVTPSKRDDVEQKVREVLIKMLELHKIKLKNAMLSDPSKLNQLIMLMPTHDVMLECLFAVMVFFSGACDLLADMVTHKTDEKLEEKHGYGGKLLFVWLFFMALVLIFWVYFFVERMLHQSKIWKHGARLRNVKLE